MPGAPLVQFSKEIPVGQMFVSTGTWTRVTNSGLPYYSKATAAEGPKVILPIDLNRRDQEIGAQLTSIDIPIRVATQNLVSTITVTVYRRNTSLAVKAGGVNMTASTITGTLTGQNLTAAATDRLLTWTATTPFLDQTKDTKSTYNAEVKFNAATTSAIRVYDAIAYFQIPT